MGSVKMPAINDADRLRNRGKRMLELATRAHCEKNHDFARLLTQLALEVFAHVRDLEERRESRTAVPARRLARESRGHTGDDRNRTMTPADAVGNHELGNKH